MPAALPPRGFWCRYCGKYISMRNAAERTTMNVHMVTHRAANDEPMPSGPWSHK